MGPRYAAIVAAVSAAKTVAARVVIAVGVSFAGACAGAGGDARAPARALPPYGAHQAELFDDGIDPQAVGFDIEGSSSPAEDALLRERAQEGDAVVRARVTTITSKPHDQSYGWQIGFHTLERIAGDGPLPDDFAMDVAPTGPAAGIVRAFEPALVGKTFIAFARTFSSKDDPTDPELHLHLALDGKAAATAVRDALALQKVR